MLSLLDTVYCFFKDRGIDPFKDIFLPFLAPDKILAIIGLIYVIRSFRNSYNLNRVNFIYQLTQAHRDIWSKIYQGKLERILDVQADPTSISEEEKRHIIYIILNVKVSYEAHKVKVYPVNKESQLDIGTFLNLPLPNNTWEIVKIYYESDFVRFVDKCKLMAKSEHKENIFTFIVIGYYKFKNSKIILYFSEKIKIFRLNKRNRKIIRNEESQNRS